MALRGKGLNFIHPVLSPPPAMETRRNPAALRAPASFGMCACGAAYIVRPV